MSIIIFGYSGHSYVVIESALSQSLTISGYLDLKEQLKDPYQLKYFGADEAILKISSLDSFKFALGLGDNSIRQQILERFINKINFVSIIDASANISKTATIGLANYIGKNTSINALASIGNACIINTNAIIEHECEIGSYTHVAPNAVLCGNVKVGNNSFIGANTVIKQGVTIGNNVTVGAGSVVIKDLENNSINVGNPSRPIKKQN